MAGEQVAKIRKTQSLPPGIADRLLTTEQAAAVLGLGTGTLNKWRCNGGSQLPYVRIHRSVRYKESTILQFIHEQEEHTTVAQARADRKG